MWTVRPSDGLVSNNNKPECGGQGNKCAGMHKESSARSTPENPFGPWLRPAHVRKRMEQIQRRMSHRSEPSTANKALNSRLDREKELSKRGVLA